MKIYSDISSNPSSSISAIQNTYVLVKGSDDIIRKAPLTVNGVAMNDNGNIAANLTAVITGLSSSLSGSPFFLSDIYTPRPPVSGTLFVVSGETGSRSGSNGEAYIFVTSSIQTGSWQQIFGFNYTVADERYVKLVSGTPQNINSSLNITGSVTFFTSSASDKIIFSSSLYWLSGSVATTPGAGVTASVVVLGDDNKLYITGAYGSGGGSTPSALTFGTQTTNYALAATDNNKVVRMNSSTNLDVYVTASLFSSGDQVIVFQSGSGQVTFIPDITTTMLSANNMRKLRTQYSAATLTFTDNTCYLFGDIAP
jgi:hypothetical protein